MKMKAAFIVFTRLLTVLSMSYPGRAFVVTTLVAETVWGQAAPPRPSPTPSAETTSPAGVVTPRLLSTPDATYPEAALAARVEGVVGLRLTIDTEGRVTAAEVVEPVGQGFDEAAREAALRFRFAPATRDGRATAARIVYRYTFALPPVPATPPVGVPIGAPTSGGPAPFLPPPAPGPSTPAATVPTRAAAAADATPPSEIVVRGQRSEGERLRQSADAVTVVDLRRARQQTADLGEVLARTPGVSVRRSGGLGSDARFSLNGLYDDQIRFFVDGVPFDVAGFPSGIANVPVNLVERVEIYRGVVPIGLGADALGGAVNLVTDQRYVTRVAASLQAGSFGTYRGTVDVRYRHEPSGFVAGAALYGDYALNNYWVEVDVPDERGRLAPANVRRFHDGYTARGAFVEAGFVDRPWARRLLVRAFASAYDKDLQNNTVMTVPYGEVTYGESVYGATARYEQSLGAGFELELVANYARRAIDFSDQSGWVYDWYGRRTYERPLGGELEARPRDQTIWQDGAFGRAGLKAELARGHALRLVTSPYYLTRTGDERLQADPTARDPLTAKRDLLTLVSGLAYELNAFESRLENVAFIKDYVYHAASEETLPGGIFRPLDRDVHSLGFGNGLRYRFLPFLYAKASYEYATRLPRPDEVFGNGVLILPNLALEPERSHNANLGPRLEVRSSPLGDMTAEVNAFLRDTDRQIVLLGNDRFFTYQNVYRARSVGLENVLQWALLRRRLTFDGALTYQEQRNASRAGSFGAFEGDRIPNRPWLLASWGARLRFERAIVAGDVLEPFYLGRYTHEFFRGWESQGLREFKQVVPSQMTHGLGVSYTVHTSATRVTSTVEMQNVTDAKVYDVFGVQRPGRGVFLKILAEVW